NERADELARQGLAAVSG
ncbi:MAG: hypothetical protein KDA48_04115, partial [Amphiplicatus sp.]|nr:hypothetical protein [Amphiplicatus sp.]